MRCKEYERLEPALADYLEGRVSPEARRAVDAHLVSCADCRHAMKDAGVSGLLLRAGWEAAPVPDAEFWFRVRAALRSEEKRAGFWQPVEALAWKMSWAAVLALALMTGYAVMQERDPALLANTPNTEAREIIPEPEQQPRTGEEVLLTLVSR